MTKPNELNIVIPHQRPLQRVWRETSQESIETYELNTMTYGTASASYLTTRFAADRLRQQRELSSGAVRRYCVIFTRG